MSKITYSEKHQAAYARRALVVNGAAHAEMEAKRRAGLARLRLGLTAAALSLATFATVWSIA